MAPKINIIKSNALVICECQTNCEILRRKTNIQKTKPLLAKATKPMPGKIVVKVVPNSVK
jgi:hypothetical protein